MLLLHHNLFTTSLFKSYQEVPISFKSFFMTSSHPRRGRDAFRLALDGWSKRTIYDALSFFIHRSCPRNLNFSFIIALESGIEQHFRTAYSFKYSQSAGYPEQSVGIFSGKHLVNLHPLFRTPMLQSHI